MDDLITRARAAVCYLNTTISYDNAANKRIQIYAFLSLFHPELSIEEKLKITNDGLSEVSK